MKRCLACGHVFERVQWTCPACGVTPQRIGRWLAFAPELAVENDGMAESSHHRLDKLQEASFWFRARNKLIVALLERYGGGRGDILEIGCGTGFVLSALHKAFGGAALSGSEIYAYALDYAASRLGPVAALYQMDARRIPFTEAFDAICAFDVLEHIEDDELVLREVHRALRPGGRFFVSVPQHPLLWSAADEIGCHKRRYRRGELDARIRDAGFAVEFSSSFVTALLPLMLVQRLTSARRRDYDPGKELALPRAVDRAFERVLDVERSLIGAGARFPVGGSRFIVAQRRAE